MNEIIWETDFENDYHIQVIKVDNDATILYVKNIGNDKIIFEQPVTPSTPGVGVSTIDIVVWMNLAKTAIEAQQ